MHTKSAIQATLISVFVAFGLIACDDESTSSDTAVDVATDTPDSVDNDIVDDAEIDGDDDLEAGEDVMEDAGIDLQVDVEPDEIIGGPCDEQWECPEQWICLEGLCQAAPECPGSSNWVRCFDVITEVDPALAFRAACVDHHCKIMCETDAHCQDGQICTDFGWCRDFDGDITGVQPGGGELTALRAGFGEALMNYPIGVPPGGYGSRAAFNEGRYAESMQSSVGQFHGLYVRGVFLDSGERQLIILRAPMIFPSMELHEDVARALQAETGADWRDSLIISATHTHSGPSRFWNLPSDGALALGAFGIGEFSQEIYDWLLESFVDAALASIADAAPARLGWEIVEAYDMDNHVGRDRWGETPPFDDNRVLLIRIDDDQGVPRAVLVSFGTHGTDNAENYLSGDVIYGAERMLEHSLGEEYERFVPVMYVNQNSGSMSPGGDAMGHRFPLTVERYGWRLSEKLFDTLVAMETNADISFDARTYRFPISFDLIGYESEDFQGNALPPIGGVYRYGGIECGGGTSWGDSDYASHAVPSDLMCIALHFLLFNLPPSVFMRSQITAIELDGLTIVTMPGELTMELSWQIVRELRDQHGVDPFKAWTWGMSQDHLLYLVPTNLRGELPPYPGITTPQAPDDYPDYAFSYLQGGYEPGMSPWGPLGGDYLAERAVEAYAALTDADFERTFPTAFPSTYTQRVQEPFPVDATDSDDVGEILTDVPATVERHETIEFAWVGGDPGAEMPQAPLVVLERQAQDDSFEEVLLPNYRTYDNRAFRFMTRLREGDAGYEWAIRWEELNDFALGDYRFRVEGHYWNGSERVPYTLTSGVFELVPDPNVIVATTASASALSGTLGYAPTEYLYYFDDIDDPGLVSGNFRMRHPLIGSAMSAPVEADDDVTSSGLTVTVRQGETTVRTDADATIDVVTTGEHVNGRNGVPVTRFTVTFDQALPAGSYAATIDVVDLHGNTGSTTIDFTVP